MQRQPQPAEHESNAKNLNTVFFHIKEKKKQPVLFRRPGAISSINDVRGTPGNIRNGSQKKTRVPIYSFTVFFFITSYMGYLYVYRKNELLLVSFLMLFWYCLYIGISVFPIPFRLLIFFYQKTYIQDMMEQTLKKTEI